MKRYKKIFIVLMCALLIAVPVTTESASAAVATNRTAKAKISGWVTVQNGQKKYYKKGQYLKGCKKIEKNYYYFGPKGVMKTQDITSHGVTYFIERNGHVLGRRKGSRYMAPDGRKLNKKQTAELRAYQNARKVVARITTSDMTDAEKLQRCFTWMQTNGFATQGRLSSGGKFWYAFNANQLFMRRRGNCIPYACAMAYMAKVIGYKDVYICSRGTKQQSFHTWTEINGVVYDSYFANRRDADKYYGIKYDDFEYGVVFRQKLPEKYSWLSK